MVGGEVWVVKCGKLGGEDEDWERGWERVVQGETQGQVDRVDVMKMEVGISKIETVCNESMIEKRSISVAAGRCTSSVNAG